MNGAQRSTAAVVVLVGAALLLWAWPRVDQATDLRRVGPGPAVPPDPAAVQRGAYLARLGHCDGCHTDRGGAPFAGGRAIGTPFGTVFAANLTPDTDTGLGRWTVDAFRRALSEGRSADGRPLLPVCPYPNFALVTERQADDLFAYLRSLPARRQAVQRHELRFPYDQPQALLAWRWRHHRPATLPAAPPGAGADWARGAALVGGLGHCSACHGRRDGWGATEGPFDLRGGEIPGQGWFAPSLADPAEAALSRWNESDALALLRSGRSPGATMSGPMAVVVAHSLQHWTEADLRAAAVFLRHLPEPAADREAVAVRRPDDRMLANGRRLYDDHCAECHGADGEGRGEDGPALADNRALALRSPVNVIKMVLVGGFGPATAGVPRPAGMPPFATLLSDEDVAAVVTYVRWRFGRGAMGVDGLEVNRLRGG